MKTLNGIVVAVGMLNAVPALAGDIGTTGFTNIWSSAQGTSNSYGHATALGTSAANSSATAGGALQGTFTSVGAVNSTTSSLAITASRGPGYAQAQTSGYAGGTATGAVSARSH
jgi:hypothetical protein